MAVSYTHLDVYKRQESVRWQLSIYAYFFEVQNPGCNAVRLIGIWLRGKNHEIVEVERIPSEVVMNLLKMCIRDRLLTLLDISC